MVESMEIQRTSSLHVTQLVDLFVLWNDHFPAAVRHQELISLENYLEAFKSPTHYVVEDQGEMIAWLCVFEREGETWFVIIVSEQYHGKGLGKQLLTEAMKDYTELNGWIVYNQPYTRRDGSPYQATWGFYQKLGFELLPEVILEKGGITSTKIRWRKRPM